MNLYGLGQRAVAGFCEHVYEHLVSIKMGNAFVV